MVIWIFRVGAPFPLEKPVKRTTMSAFKVGAGILLSRVAGLVRVRIFAHFLGNSDAAGAFNAALRIPNLLQNLFGEGALSASFIPVYSRLLAEEKFEEAGHVAGTVLSLLILVIGALTVIGVTFTHDLINLVSPGFVGETRALTEQLVKIMFPGTGLLVLSAWCLGILNSHRQFFLSYVAPVFWNIAMITTLICFGQNLMATDLGRAELARLVGWATVAGAGLQFCAQLPFSIKANRGLRPSLDIKSDAIRKILKNFLPAIITRGVVQLSAFIDLNLASFLGPQAVAGMAYAQTIYLLPISLFGMSVSAAELPEMSRSAVGTDSEVAHALRDRLVKAIGRLAFFVIPSAIAFLALGDVVVGMLLQTGEFSQDSTNYVWLILAGSSLGLLASTQARLCVSVFWALRDTRTPMNFAMLRVFLTAILGYIAVFPMRTLLSLPNAYSAAGLTASAGLAGWIEFYLIKRALTERIGRIPVGGPTILRCWTSGLIAAAVAFVIKRLLFGLAPLPLGGVVIAAYGLIYIGLTIGLGVEEPKVLLQPILRRIRR